MAKYVIDEQILKDLADAIRAKDGSTELLKPADMSVKVAGIETTPETIILVDEEGHEVTAVLTDEVVEITATPNDVRAGTTAVMSTGLGEGMKEIPSYHTTEGMVVVQSGQEFVIADLGKAAKFTKLQALLCTSSTAAQKVCINTNVYNAGSSTVVSNVTVDDLANIVSFNITNEESVPYVIRYFTYREEM